MAARLDIFILWPMATQVLSLEKRKHRNRVGLSNYLKDKKVYHEVMTSMSSLMAAYLEICLHILYQIFLWVITDHVIKQIKAGPIKYMTRTLLIWLNLTRGCSLMMYRPHCPGQQSAININLHLQFIQIRMTKPEY